MSDLFRELSPRQRRAILALLTSKTMEEASQAVGVTSRTLRRWLDLPEFRRALNEAEGDILAKVTRRLLSGSDEALDTLNYVMTAGEKPSDRRLAAAAWLELATKFLELKDFGERISKLEEALLAPAKY